MFILQELKKEAESARLAMQAKLELEKSTQRKNLIQSEIDGLLIKTKQSDQDHLKSEEEIKQLQEQAKQHLEEASRGMEELERYRNCLLEAFENFEFENLA